MTAQQRVAPYSQPADGLLKGERGRYVGEKMEDKPINKPLVIISFIVITFGAGWDVASGPIQFDEPMASIMAGICLLVSPLFVLWFKAVWNEIIPRVTTWRKLSFLEAAGLMIIPWFFTR